MQQWYWIIMATVFGGCVGSFLNVVIYRVPEGHSLVTPGSRCPSCGKAIAWHDNVPVLAWLWLLGRCRFCKAGISIQYPLIEALCAALFGSITWVYYYSGYRPDFMSIGLMHSWPVLVVHLVLVGALIAATVIDAKLFIIPLGIPWTVTLVALIGLPVMTFWFPSIVGVRATVGDAGIWAAIGGAGGLTISIVLLQLGLLPRSFEEDIAHEVKDTTIHPVVDEALTQPAADELSAISQNDLASSVVSTPDDVPAITSVPDGEDGTITAPVGPPAATLPADMPEMILSHPHPRREVLKEVSFVAIPFALMLLMYQLGQDQLPLLTTLTGSPLPMQVLGGVVIGYLVGGGIVWFTRIVGTLAFGREAMGLGDVHLLAAIGAALGAVEAVATFFIAPFLGLAYVAITFAIGRLIHGQTRVIPYGPFLALAAVLVMIFRTSIFNLFHLP